MKFLGLSPVAWAWIVLQASYLIFFVKLHLGQREIIRRLDQRLAEKAKS